jgi:hypothetical protein
MPRMRQVIGIVALTVLCNACGDGGGGPREPSGVYALELPDGCVVVYSFRPDEGFYAESLQCDLESGTAGAQVESGPYRIEGDRIYFTPDETSCEDQPLEDSDLKFKLYDNGDLFLSDGSFAAEFVKIPQKELDGAGPTGSLVGLGCWDDEDFVSR